MKSPFYPLVKAGYPLHNELQDPKLSAVDILPHYHLIFFVNMIVISTRFTNKNGVICLFMLLG